MGSHDIADSLPSPPFGFARHYGFDTTGEGTVPGMLIAKGATDIAIDGQGDIGGQGGSFVGMQISPGGNDYEAASAERALETIRTCDERPSAEVRNRCKRDTSFLRKVCGRLRMRDVQVA